MATCRECAYLRKCIDKATKEGYEHNVDFDPKDGCPGWGFKSKADAETNADRIRAMSDDELAKWIDWLFGRAEWCDTDKMATDDCNDVECTSCILEWLKQPPKGE